METNKEFQFSLFAPLYLLSQIENIGTFTCFLVDYDLVHLSGRLHHNKAQVLYNVVSAGVTASSTLVMLMMVIKV